MDAAFCGYCRHGECVVIFYSKLGYDKKFPGDKSPLGRQ